MTVSPFIFQIVITIALLMTIVSPILLAIFWIKDWKDKTLW